MAQEVEAKQRAIGAGDMMIIAEEEVKHKKPMFLASLKSLPIILLCVALRGDHVQSPDLEEDKADADTGMMKKK